jgi:hypothetical protein
MDRQRRSILQVTATTVIAAIMSAAAPVAAAESAVMMGKVAGTGSATVKPDDFCRRRLAAARVIRKHHDWGLSNHQPDCSGGSCGRQFVLIVGVAY